MTYRIRFVVGLALGVLFVAPAWADTLFTDNFDAANQPLSSYSSNYVVGDNIAATIVNGRLRVAEAAGYPSNNQRGVDTISGLIGTSGPGTVVMADVKASETNFNLFLKVGGAVAYRNYLGRSGYWDGNLGRWELTGSNQVTAGAERHYAVLYVGNRSAHLFVDRQYNGTLTDPGGDRQDVGPGGDVVNLRIQSPVVNTSVHAEYDNFAALTLDYNSAGAATAVKGGLVQAFADDFSRSELGAGWSEGHSALGNINVGLANQRVEMRVTDGTSNPWALATLDLTDPGILGRGLQVGEMIQFDLRRNQAGGSIGLKPAWGGNHGFLNSSGDSAFSVWTDNFGTDQGSGWRTITPGQTFDPDAWQTMAARLDYADGETAVLSYYIDENYVGSWLYGATGPTMDAFSFFAQNGGYDTTFWFDNLAIFTLPPDIVPEPCSLLLLGLGGASLIRYRRRLRA